MDWCFRWRWDILVFRFTFSISFTLCPPSLPVFYLACFKLLDYFKASVSELQSADKINHVDAEPANMSNWNYILSYFSFIFSSLINEFWFAMEDLLFSSVILHFEISWRNHVVKSVLGDWRKRFLLAHFFYFLFFLEVSFASSIIWRIDQNTLLDPTRFCRWNILRGRSSHGYSKRG